MTYNESMTAGDIARDVENRKLLTMSHRDVRMETQKMPRESWIVTYRNSAP
jgi:hypothetical protein